MNQLIQSENKHVYSSSFDDFRLKVEKEFIEEMRNTGFTLTEIYMQDEKIMDSYGFNASMRIKRCRIRLFNVLLEESRKHNLLYTDFINILNIKNLIQWKNK